MQVNLRSRGTTFVRKHMQFLCVDTKMLRKRKTPFRKVCYFAVFSVLGIQIVIYQVISKFCND